MIIVIGSINLDLIADVDRLPAPGETVPGSTFKTAPGGKGANQALAAARAGASVRMIGAVGKDAFATEALALLKQAGVDTSAIMEAHAATGVALILVAGDGENVIAVIPGSNSAVLPGDVAKANFERGTVLVLQNEVPLPTNRAALDAARSAGAVSILNTAPFRAEAADLLGLADYIVANETEFDLYAEALSLPGKDRESRMKAFVASTGRCIIVTLGGDGVVAVGLDAAFSVPAMSITPIDTVGAGDTFCGYLAAGIETGLPLKDAVLRAATAGSLACLKAGAQPAIPLAAEVEAALAGQPLS